ncbi:hypothetical protein VPHD69_0310 [Vibrio phage D69]
MTDPTDDQLRALLSDTAEGTREWMEEILFLTARLQYVHEENVGTDDMEIWDGMARAKVTSSGRGYTDTIGTVELGLDEFIAIRDNPESLHDIVTKQRMLHVERERAKQKAAEVKRKADLERAEKAQYERLKRKFG